MPGDKALSSIPENGWSSFFPSTMIMELHCAVVRSGLIIYK